MSLIITNKILKNVAVIILEQSQGDVEIKQEGDLVKIINNDKVVGLNIFNYDKYFEVQEGAHTLSETQVKAIKEKLGFEITNYESKFVIGEVIEREQHPKSERLFVLKVKTDKELTIVTNSLNSTVGKKVVVATVGATLPSGMDIVHSKVMGVASEGMLTGGETLGKEKTEGVLIVDGTPGEKYIL